MDTKRYALSSGSSNPLTLGRGGSQQRDNNRAFNFMAIINTDKWQSFANRDQLQMVIAQTPNANLRDVYIKNPNNPAQLRTAKLIEFWQ